MSPVFGHGHLRLYLLSLLAEHPRHGYELIQALSERFGGTYSPSAGTIYPRLAKLEEEALVTKASDGRKTVYAITETGRAELASRQSELLSIEDQVTDSVRMLADEVRAGVNQAMKSLRAELAVAAQSSRSSDGEKFSERGGNSEKDSSSLLKHQKTGKRNGPQPRTSPARQRQDTREALRQAEIDLAEFRQQVRTDLRKQAAHGVVSEATVERFAERLLQLRAELKAELDGS